MQYFSESNLLHLCPFLHLLCFWASATFFHSLSGERVFNITQVCPLYLVSERKTGLRSEPQSVTYEFTSAVNFCHSLGLQGYFLGSDFCYLMSRNLSLPRSQRAFFWAAGNPLWYPMLPLLPFPRGANCHAGVHPSHTTAVLCTYLPVSRSGWF